MITCQRCGCQDYSKLREVTIGVKYATNLCINCINAWEEYIYNNSDCNRLDELQACLVTIEAQTKRDGIDRSDDLVRVLSEGRDVGHRIFLTAKAWVEEGVETGGKPQNAPQA